jgi:hypothetical protein
LIWVLNKKSGKPVDVIDSDPWKIAKTDEISLK